MIRRYPPNESYKILPFGSWATLEAAPTSDIDIAILGLTPVDPAIMSEIHEEVDELPTLRKIQVIDGVHVQERFRDRILHHDVMERAEAVRTFEQALRRLQEVLREPESALVRDAAMNRCEFTFELAWKAVQRLLREPGVLCHSPKGCLREPSPVEWCKTVHCGFG